MRLSLKVQPGRTERAIFAFRSLNWMNCGGSNVLGPRVKPTSQLCSCNFNIRHDIFEDRSSLNYSLESGWFSHQISFEVRSSLEGRTPKHLASERLYLRVPH
jgi:hypothetical protein